MVHLLCDQFSSFRIMLKANVSHNSYMVSWRTFTPARGTCTIWDRRTNAIIGVHRLDIYVLHTYKHSSTYFGGARVKSLGGAFDQQAFPTSLRFKSYHTMNEHIRWDGFWWVNEADRSPPTSHVRVNECMDGCVVVYRQQKTQGNMGGS